ncbi:MAG: hypothetical protein HY810_04255 [Candidatus Omnitrophica bacterium]|nr:hypothetical protein [Candidatus Omnitrophota bacterium]
MKILLKIISILLIQVFMLLPTSGLIAHPLPETEDLLSPAICIDIAQLQQVFQQGVDKIMKPAEPDIPMVTAAPEILIQKRCVASVTGYLNGNNWTSLEQKSRINNLLYEFSPFIITSYGQEIGRAQPGLCGLLVELLLSANRVRNYVAALNYHKTEGHFIQYAISAFQGAGIYSAVEDLEWLQATLRDQPDKCYPLFINYLSGWITALGFTDTQIMAKNLRLFKGRSHNGFQSKDWNKRHLFWMEKILSLMPQGQEKYLFFNQVCDNFFAEITDLSRRDNILVIEEIGTFWAKSGLKENCEYLLGKIINLYQLAQWEWDYSFLDETIMRLAQTAAIPEEKFSPLIPGGRFLPLLVNKDKQQTGALKTRIITKALAADFGAFFVKDGQLIKKMEDVLVNASAWGSLQRRGYDKEDYRSYRIRERNLLKQVLTALNQSGQEFGAAAKEVEFLGRRGETELLSEYLEALKTYLQIQLLLYGKYQKTSFSDVINPWLAHFYQDDNFKPLINLLMEKIVQEYQQDGRLEELEQCGPALARISPEIAGILKRLCFDLDNSFTDQEKRLIIGLNQQQAVLSPAQARELKKNFPEPSSFRGALDIITLFPEFFNYPASDVSAVLRLTGSYQLGSNVSGLRQKAIRELLSSLREVYLKKNYLERPCFQSWARLLFFKVLAAFTEFCTNENIFLQIVELEKRYARLFSAEIVTALSEQNYQRNAAESLGRWAGHFGVAEAGDLGQETQDALLALVKLTRSDEEKQEYISFLDLMLANRFDPHVFLNTLWELDRQGIIDAGQSAQSILAMSHTFVREKVNPQIFFSAVPFLLKQGFTANDIFADLGSAELLAQYLSLMDENLTSEEDIYRYVFVMHFALALFKAHPEWADEQQIKSIVRGIVRHYHPDLAPVAIHKQSCSCHSCTNRGNMPGIMNMIESLIEQLYPGLQREKATSDNIAGMIINGKKIVEEIVLQSRRLFSIGNDAVGDLAQIREAYRSTVFYDFFRALEIYARECPEDLHYVEITIDELLRRICVKKDGKKFIFNTGSDCSVLESYVMIRNKLGPKLLTQGAVDIDFFGNRKGLPSEEGQYALPDLIERGKIGSPAYFQFVEQAI